MTINGLSLLFEKPCVSGKKAELVGAVAFESGSLVFSLVIRLINAFDGRQANRLLGVASPNYLAIISCFLNGYCGFI